MSPLAIKVRSLTDHAYLVSTTTMEHLDRLPVFTWEIILQSVKNELIVGSTNPKQELPEKGEVFWDQHKNILNLKWENAHFRQRLLSPLNPSKLQIELDHDELIYGFGEWFNQFGEDKLNLELYNREAPGVLQKIYTYGAHPLFMSNKGYMVLVLNASKCKVQLKRSERSLSMNFSSGNIHYLLVRGNSPKELLHHYTEITGKPPFLPKWAFGLWQTSFPVEGQQEVIERVNKHQNLNIPLHSVILDYHWENSFHDFQWREELFTHPDAFIKDLKQRGIKLGIISTPYMNSPHHSWMSLFFSTYVAFIPKILSRFKIFHDQKLYEEGLKKKYYIHSKIAWWLGKAGAIDFTNKQASSWWFGLQKKLISQGVRFIKNDAGEHLPDSGEAANGLKGSELHNIYAFYYSRETFKFLQENLETNERPFIFSRSSWPGSHRYSAIFLGDQKPNFSSIASTMRGGLNLSLSGHVYWGADVLGLFGMPNEQEFIAQLQWSMMTPIARYFSSIKLPKREPWNMGEKALEHFKKYAHLRLSLLPLYYRLARESSLYGTPIIRPLFLEFPNDQKVEKIWDQVMLGDTIMICPKTSAQQEMKKVYFPQGFWRHYKTGEVYVGPGEEEIAMNDELLMFVEDGHLIAKKMGQDLSFDHLVIDLAPTKSQNASTKVYDDSGDGLQFLHEEFEEQEFFYHYNETEHRGYFIARAATGNFSTSNPKRKITIAWKYFENKFFKIELDGIISEHHSTEPLTIEWDKSKEHTLHFRSN